MFCTKCGQAYESGAKFCITCGARLEQQDWVDQEAGNQGESFRFHALPKRKNGPGLASFILALASVVIWIVGIALSVALALESRPDDDPMVMLTGLLILTAFGATIAGLILGIIGAAMKGRRHGLAVAGLIINALLLVAVVLLIIVGATMG